MSPERLRRLQDQSVEGRRVLVRADFNVPLQDGRVLDDTRIRAALPTLRHLLEKNAVVAVCSHLGRPRGVEASLSLRPVAERLAALLERPVRALPDCVGPQVAEAVAALRAGEVALLENLRFHPEEKRNDPGFARELAAPFELFVQDAFGVLHRAHASTEGITRHLPACAGLLVQRELEHLSRLLDRPARPFVALIGGKKAEEKVGGLFGLLERVDAFLLGGGVAFTFLRARGVSVGRSVVSEAHLATAERFVREAYARGATVVLPRDVQAAPSLDAAERAILPVERLPEDWMGLDIGPETVKDYRRRLQEAGTVFWAGPMGAFEHPPFDRGTLELARTLARAQAFAVIGGGETAAAFSRAGVEAPHVFVSTGGGASLAFVAGERLPGLAALTAAA